MASLRTTVGTTRAGALALAALLALPAGRAAADTCTTPSFTDLPFVTVENNPANIVVGDWNRDGKLDFAVTNFGSHSVSIRLGDGSGGFMISPPVDLQTQGNEPTGIAVGHLNGDQYLDLAVATQQTGRVRFLQGAAGGTFTPTGSDLTGLTGAQAVATGDFDSDGLTDLAVTSTGTNEVVLYLRTGGFAFNGGQRVTVGQAPSALAVGDFDRDGDLDVAAANAGSNNVSILLNTGLGLFAEYATRFSVGTNPRSIAAADINRDGFLDLVTADYLSNQLSFLRGSAPPTYFTAAGTVGTPQGPAWVATADFNRDGLLDVAAAASISNPVSIRLGLGGFSFGPANDFSGSAPLGLGIGDFNRDGRPDVLRAFNNGSAVGVALNDAGFPCLAHSFGPAGRLFDASAFPVGIVKGDFDNDGRLDVVVSTDLATNPDAVTRLRAIGPGLFGPPATFTTGAGTQVAPRIAAGDFDGDGRLDVVTANNASNNVTILPGTAAGFGPPIVMGSGGTGPVSPVVGDFDKDGKLDFAVSNNTSGEVAVFLNSGAGFSFTGPTTLTVGAGVTEIAAGDMNGDGLLDLVAGVGTPSPTRVKILLGQLGGGFGAPITSPGMAGTEPMGVVLGDWNGDAKLDVAVSIRDANMVVPFLGLGNGSLLPPSLTLAVGQQPEMIVAEDFDNNGRLDLATANTLGGGTVSVILASGPPGNFAAATSYPSAPAAYGITAGDFTGDGQVDLVTTNPTADSVLLLVGNGLGSFGTASSLSNGGFFADATEVGDFDRDGIPDLVVAASADGVVRVNLGDGTGLFPTAVNTPVPGSNLQHAVPADFDRDGVLDVVVADIATDTIQILKGTGSGAFAPLGAAATAGANSDPIHLAVADFDRDGDLDVAAALSGAGSVAVYLYVGGANPLGTAPFSGFATGGSPTAVVAGDFDGDGLVDLAAADQSTSNVTVRRGLGNGNFNPWTVVPTGAAPFSLVADDFDRDGDLDLATANSGAEDITILQNPGNGFFSFLNTWPTGGRPFTMVAADFNRDGVLDLATAQQTVSTVSVLLGDGSGGFPSLATYGPEGPPFGLAVGDFNRDGDADLVSANGTARTLSSFSNTTCASRRFELTQRPGACNSPNVAFAFQPRLRLTDDGDNFVQCDSNQVTASIVPGTGTGGAVLGGLFNQSAFGGNVNYPNLSINLAGVHYRLGFARSGTNPPIPARTPRFTVGLDVDISGPAVVCSGQSTAWSALAPPFVIPPVYDKYDWHLDATPLAGDLNVVVPPQTPGPYVLRLDATLDACTAIKTRPFVAEAPPTVTATASGATTVCTSCSGAFVTANESGGGTITGRQWGYRTVSGPPPIIDIPGQTGPTYTIQGGHFNGGTPGRYFLVVTSTGGCGGAVTSNEIEVIVFNTVVTGTKFVFTATSKDQQNTLEWLNPAGPYVETLVRYNKSATGTSSCTFPINPGDGTLLTSQAGVAGGRDSKLHDLLENDTAYCYAAFVATAPFTYSVPGETVKARPFDNTAGFVKWAFSTGVATLSPPGMGQGVIHVVDNDGAVHSVKKGDSGGTWADPPWKPPVLPQPSQTGRPGSVPVTAGGQNPVMFLSSQDGHLYSFGATNGTAAWAAPPTLGVGVQAPPSAVFAAFSGGLVSVDLLFVGTRNPTTPNTFYALRLSDGSFAAPGWLFSGGGAGSMGMINGQAAVDYATKRVYFASTEFAPTAPDNNTLWCVNFETGLPCGPTWPHAYGSISGAVSLRDDTLYVGIDGGGVRALDAATGNPVWPTPFSTTGTVKGFVYADRLSDDLYFSTGGRIYSVADSAGVAVPNWGVSGVIFTNPSTPVFIPNDNKVYVGGSNRLYRVRKLDGSPLDDFVLGDPAVPTVVGSPTIDVLGGFIYVGTDAGVVYAIRIP